MDEADIPLTSPVLEKNSTENLIKKQPRKRSTLQKGWDETTLSKTRSSNDSVDLDDTAQVQEKTTVVGDSRNDIIVPDLEEEKHDQIDATVAAPPPVKINRVFSLGQLEDQLDASMSTSINKSVGGIDLSLLYSVLSPPQDVLDPDVFWDWDVVFTEVVGGSDGLKEEAASARSSRVSGVVKTPKFSSHVI